MELMNAHDMTYWRKMNSIQGKPRNEKKINIIFKQDNLAYYNKKNNCIRPNYNQ